MIIRNTESEIVRLVENSATSTTLHNTTVLIKRRAKTFDFEGVTGAGLEAVASDMWIYDLRSTIYEREKKTRNLWPGNAFRSHARELCIRNHKFAGKRPPWLQLVNRKS